MKTADSRADRIAAARGDRPCELLLRNARLINVLSGEIHPADIAIFDGRVVALGARPARRMVNLEGRYVAPGFLDAHVHLESSMVLPGEFARAVVPLGTTGVFADPHELANVVGARGVEAMIAASEGLPLRVFLLAPSCVPATHMETSGARLTAADIRRLLRLPRVLGLAEVMNFPGVIHRDPGVLAKLAAAEGRIVDGHAPGVTGADLDAYVAAGIGSDHECTTADEAREKARRGMQVFLREGTAARNLLSLLPAVTADNASRFCLCTDDRHPADLQQEGHIGSLLALCVKHGMPPVRAVQLATLNTARYFGIPRLGAVAPGWHADLVVLDDLTSFRPSAVYATGRLVARRGRYALSRGAGVAPAILRRTMRVKVDRLDLRGAAGPRGAASARMRVIELVPGQIVTRQARADLTLRDGYPVADPRGDCLKLVVVERHTGSNRVGVGWVRGFGLRAGALASSVAHDSHNIVAVGVGDDDLRAAIRQVVAWGGGQVAVRDGRVLAGTPLPLAGLLSDRPLPTVRRQVDAVNAAARRLGCPLPDALMTLAFLALPVIPELKLTDRGLVDVEKFQMVPVFADRTAHATKMP